MIEPDRAGQKKNKREADHVTLSDEAAHRGVTPDGAGSHFGNHLGDLHALSGYLAARETAGLREKRLQEGI